MLNVDPVKSKQRGEKESTMEGGVFLCQQLIVFQSAERKENVPAEEVQSLFIGDKGVISLMTQKENIWPRNFKASPHSGR